MDFTMDSEQRALRDAAAALADRHVPVRAGRDIATGPAPFDPALWSALAELGALGLPFAEDAGGFGASAVEAWLVAGELGRAGVSAPYAEALVAASLLAAAGSPLVEAVVGGESVVLPALSEPGRAWGTEPVTRAVENAGAWTITGTKGPVIAAGAADHVVVDAITEGGVGLFLLDGSAIDETGLVHLDSTPATVLIGADGSEAALTGALGLGRAVLAGEAVGAMEEAVRLTTAYLQSRKQFGVPLMTFQTLTQRAADMYVSLELARSAALYAAMTVSEDPGDAAAVSRAMVVVDKSARHIGQEAIQLHGGIGMTAEYPVGHLTTRLTAITHTFGDSRWHVGQLAANLSGHDQVDVLE